MRHIRRFENPVLSRVIREQWKFSRICCGLIIQSVLLLVICQLLFRAKLGPYTNLIFISEALVVLMAPPYLACSGLTKYLALLRSRGDLQLSRLRPQWVWLNVILGSQVYTFCFLVLAMLVFIILIPAISNITYLEVVQLHLVFGIYIVVSASVGGLCWRVFRHEIFATGATYLGWTLLIGGVCLLAPLDRHLENLQLIIPPFLHLNPLIAVCHLLELDVFRTPHLYELTPIPSYLVIYPSWYIVCGWQILIGICCLTLTWWNRA